MDLRWFIKPGFEDKTVVAAVRFSDFAMVGRGLGTSVHGGAVETCLDETTAECAKAKCFPLASTAKIELKILKPVQPNVTYRVFAKVENERVKGLSYDVYGELTDAKDEKVKYATCVALMANASALPAKPEAEVS